MSDLTLVSHTLCPYVQRAAIALTEKAVPFRRIDVDLAAKPDWFTRLSPLGKVPLLIVRDGAEERAVFESAVILEYLEETRGHPLHPADPLARAEERSWIEFGSAVLNEIGRFYNAPDEAALRHSAEALAAMFGRIEVALGQGPWFRGAAFGLVDAVFAPVFRYFDVFDRIGDFGILDGTPKARAWRRALAARPSVQQAVTGDYPELLAAFIARRGGALARRQRRAA